MFSLAFSVAVHGETTTGASFVVDVLLLVTMEASYLSLDGSAELFVAGRVKTCVELFFVWHDGSKQQQRQQ